MSLLISERSTYSITYANKQFPQQLPLILRRCMSLRSCLPHMSRIFVRWYPTAHGFTAADRILPQPLSSPWYILWDTFIFIADFIISLHSIKTGLHPPRSFYLGPYDTKNLINSHTNFFILAFGLEPLDTPTTLGVELHEMYLSNTLIAVGSLGYFSMRVLAAPAPQADDLATTAFIMDPAAVTSAPIVPDTGEHIAEDVATSAGVLSQARVHNNCPFPVYVYACGQHPAACGPEKTLPAKSNGHAVFAEGYSTVNNGRSLKIGRKPGKVAKPILQFEYTNTGTGQIAYDLSEVNGNPFGPFGYHLQSDNPSCAHRECPPPGSHKACPFVFTNPTNGHVFDCPASSSIGVTLCT